MIPKFRTIHLTDDINSSNSDRQAHHEFLAHFRDRESARAVLSRFLFLKTNDPRLGWYPSQWGYAGYKRKKHASKS